MTKWYDQSLDEIIDYRTSPNGQDVFERLHKIGSGSFGDVYKGRVKATNEIVAIKTVALKQADVEVLRDEMNIHRHITGHHNIASLFGTYMVVENSERFVWMVMQYCVNGCLCDLVSASPKRRLPEKWISYICYEILQGLKHMHGLRIIHRDIKGLNVLLDHRMRVKIVDFGVSERLEDDENGFTSFVGSMYWMAPEVIACRPKHSGNYYSFTADIWSLGVLLIELAEGFPPLYNPQDPRAEIYDRVVNEPAATLKPLRSESTPWTFLMHDFLAKCFEKDFRKRRTADSLLSHEFIMKNTSSYGAVVAAMIKFKDMYLQQQLQMKAERERMRNQKWRGKEEERKIQGLAAAGGKPNKELPLEKSLDYNKCIVVKKQKRLTRVKTFMMRLSGQKPTEMSKDGAPLTPVNNNGESQNDKFEALTPGHVNLRLVRKAANNGVRPHSMISGVDFQMNAIFNSPEGSNDSSIPSSSCYKDVKYSAAAVDNCESSQQKCAPVVNHRLLPSCNRAAVLVEKTGELVVNPSVIRARPRSMYFAPGSSNNSSSSSSVIISGDASSNPKFISSSSSCSSSQNPPLPPRTYQSRYGRPDSAARFLAIVTRNDNNHNVNMTRPDNMPENTRNENFIMNNVSKSGDLSSNMKLCSTAGMVYNRRSSSKFLGGAAKIIVPDIPEESINVSNDELLNIAGLHHNDKKQQPVIRSHLNIKENTQCNGKIQKESASDDKAIITLHSKSDHCASDKLSLTFNCKENSATQGGQLEDKLLKTQRFPSSNNQAPILFPSQNMLKYKSVSDTAIYTNDLSTCNSDDSESNSISDNQKQQGLNNKRLVCSSSTSAIPFLQLTKCNSDDSGLATTDNINKRQLLTTRNYVKPKLLLGLNQQRQELIIPDKKTYHELHNIDNNNKHARCHNDKQNDKISLVNRQDKDHRIIATILNNGSAHDSGIYSSASNEKLSSSSTSSNKTNVPVAIIVNRNPKNHAVAVNNGKKKSFTQEYPNMLSEADSVNTILSSVVCRHEIENGNKLSGLNSRPVSTVSSKSVKGALRKAFCLGTSTKCDIQNDDAYQKAHNLMNVKESTKKRNQETIQTTSMIFNEENYHSKHIAYNLVRCDKNSKVIQPANHNLANYKQGNPNTRL